MLSDFARKLTLKSPRRWMSPRLWALVVGLFIAAQLGLALHQSQHHLRPDVVAADECALCQVATGMAPPATPLLILPVFILLAIISAPPIAVRVPVRARSPFRSRAPPVSH